MASSSFSIESIKNEPGRANAPKPQSSAAKVDISRVITNFRYHNPAKSDRSSPVKPGSEPKPAETEIRPKKQKQVASDLSESENLGAARKDAAFKMVRKSSIPSTVGKVLSMD